MPVDGTIQLAYQDTAWFNDPLNAEIILKEGQHVYLSDGTDEVLSAYVVGDGVTELQYLDWKGLIYPSGVQSVTGVNVDNTDPVNPVIKPLYKVKGFIYNKSTWTNTTDFTTNGASIALNGSYLDLSGGTGSYTKSVDLNNSSQLDKWKIETTFEVASAVAAPNYGMGVGKRSINTNNFDLLARIETWQSPASLFISANGIDIATSASSLPMTIGSIITLSIERNGYNVVATASNGTNSITVSYDFSTAYGTTAFLDNTGKYALYSFGGTQTIQKLSVGSSEQIDNELMIIGDSKIQGYYLSREFNRLNNLLENTTINAGGNDTTVEVLDRISEIIALNPKKVILSIGSNDIRYGRSLASVQTDYSSIVTQLTSAGIEVYHIVPPETILIALEAWIKSTYSATYISAVWDCLSDSDGSLKSIYDAGDAVHINDSASRLISNCILNTGFFNTIYSKLSNNRIASLSDLSGYLTSATAASTYVSKTSWVNISSSVTVTGYSGTPTVSVWYKIVDGIVHLLWNLTGTSNTTGIVISDLPFTINASQPTNYVVCRVTNNGAAATVAGRARLEASNNTLIIQRDLTGATFTTSGTKASEGQIIGMI